MNISGPDGKDCPIGARMPSSAMKALVKQIADLRMLASALQSGDPSEGASRQDHARMRPLSDAKRFDSRQFRRTVPC